MTNPYRGLNLRTTPQTEPARTDQVRNNAGGYVFGLDPMAHARRFLILGTDQATFYQSAPDLTRENARVVIDLAQTEPQKLVDLIVDVSSRGLAPKQDPGIFALALVCATATPEGKAYARSFIRQVCRTGTALFMFVTFFKQFSGIGRGMRTALSDWYLQPDVDSVAYQVVKYRQRDGMSHRDVLRIAHPRTVEPARRALFDWIAGPKSEVTTPEDMTQLPPIVRAFEKVQTLKPAEAVQVIQEHRLPWETLPDALTGDVTVWEALLNTRGALPLGALIRQLPKLTRLGVLQQGTPLTAQVAARLTDHEELRRARVHPLKQLIAMRTYARGQGRGSSWTPVPALVDALDESFYAAYEAFEPARKRTMVALDVSPSMWGNFDPTGLISAAEVGVALAMTMVATEPYCQTVMFSSAAAFSGYGYRRQLTAVEPVELSKRVRLDDAMRRVEGRNWGGTDCALPMMHATAQQLEIDTFVIVTDNDTYAGSMHPYQALKQYRDASGIPARLAVLSVTPSAFSIADPGDGGMLDIAGFGADVPALLTAFSRGDV